jgi:hypothetical protein
MDGPSFLHPGRDSVGAIRFGLALYVVGLAGPILLGFLGSAKVAGALLVFFGPLAWYFVAAFSVLDRRYLARVDASWQPDGMLAVGCLIPFLNLFSGYFYLRERAKYVPAVVDLERYGDGTRHA